MSCHAARLRQERQRHTCPPPPPPPPPQPAADSPCLRSAVCCVVCAVIIISGGPNSNDFAAKYDLRLGRDGAVMTTSITIIYLFVHVSRNGLSAVPVATADNWCTLHCGRGWSVAWLAGSVCMCMPGLHACVGTCDVCARMCEHVNVHVNGGGGAYFMGCGLCVHVNVGRRRGAAGVRWLCGCGQD